MRKVLCEVRNRGEVIIAAMPPMIDHIAAQVVEKELRELVAREPKALFCDFSQTKYLSSSALRALLIIGKVAKSEGLLFGVFSTSPFVDHILAVSGFATPHSIFDNEESAVRAATRK